MYQQIKPFKNSMEDNGSKKRSNKTRIIKHTLFDGGP